MKLINITEKHDAALTQAILTEKANRTNMSKGRIKTAKMKLAEFLENKAEKTDCYFLFGKTFSKKTELKTAGWKWDGNVQAWWSRESLDSCGFMKISA